MKKSQKLHTDIKNMRVKKAKITRKGMRSIAFLMLLL